MAAACAGEGDAMTATPAVIRLSAGNRLLATSFGSTDLAPPDAHPSLQFAPAAPKLTVVSHRASSAPALAPPLPLPPPPADPAPELDTEFEFESSLEAIVLLQRSMLEKQWELPFEDEDEDEEDERLSKATVVVARSGVSARQRRMSGRRRGPGRKNVTISPELMQSRNRIYLRGTVSKDLLTHKQVIQLSRKIKDGIWLQHQRSK